ncbi:phage capsid protein [Edaphobacter acidisoli]|uniref:Phage capsid protein n=1 Tax=Edaphobacter acidisoli TaxID=2040573 RepID=A0A916S2F0_9BACT|nr:phage major capsid protein [Edaphobacter acidisoli]GGA80744.1 phage capsid protein [Edaphobacter acidisoli]
MNIMQLVQKKAEALKKARALSTLAESENRDLTDAESAEFDALMASIKSYSTNIDRAAGLLEAERTAPTVDASATGAAGASAGHNRGEDKPWRNFGEFLGAVKATTIRGGHVTDPRLQAALGASETSDADGGFLVPTEQSTEIIDRVWNEGQVSGRADRTPMRTSRLTIPGVNEDSRLPGFRYGGIAVYREAEAALYNSSKPNFKLIELINNKLIGLLYATEELLEDTDALSAWASKTFPKAMAFTLDDECINGLGSGQFLGILNSGALVIVAKDSGQAAATITTSNILNMHAASLASGRKNSVWFINQNIESQLYALTIPGDMGTAVALYVQPGMRGNNDGGYGTILGHPVIPIEQAATLGTVGDIILADMDQYLIGERSGIRADSSIHVQFLTGQTAFRWMMRNDGKPKQKAPVTPYKGSQALSSFVAVATRS